MSVKDDTESLLKLHIFLFERFQDYKMQMKI